MNISSTGNIASRTPLFSTQDNSSVVVQPGDSLSGIAKRHHLTLENLLDANPHKRSNPNFIRPGEVINIPNIPPGSGQMQKAAAQPSTPNFRQPSAMETGTSPVLRDLTAAHSTHISAGDRGRLQIIAAPSKYTVAPGDNLWKIAQKTGVTLDALRDANGLHPADDRRLQVGKELRLPQGAKAISSIERSTSAPIQQESTKKHTSPTEQTNGIHQSVPVRADKNTTVIGERIATEAKSHLGKSATSLMESTELPSMMKRNDPTRNCANFVSAVLVKVGLLNMDEHRLGVNDLKNMLINNKNWVEIDFRGSDGKINLENLKEGDIVFMQNNLSHVEFIARNDAGQIVTTGSNGEKSQSISHHEGIWWQTNATTVLRHP